jgi:cell division protein FtsL
VKTRQIRWLGETQPAPVAPTAAVSDYRPQLSNLEKILLASVIVSAASLGFNIWSVYREHLANQ